MRLQILSDLHLEFAHIQIEASDADVIVLPGDIWKGDGGIYWARETWPDKPIVYVAGNHEFYGKVRKETLAKLHIAAEKTGVHFLDNDEVVIDGVRFLGSTLWTDFELNGDKNADIVNAQNRISDFRVIHEGNAHFSPMDSIVLHEKSIAWLTEKLDEEYEGKTIVVTHHLPSMLSVAERFKSEALNAAFASNLDHVFGKSELWIHGHTHDSFDYTVNGTRVLCNPRGYCIESREENDGFNPNLIVELNDKSSNETNFCDS